MDESLKENTPLENGEDVSKEYGQKKISGKAWGVLQFRKLRAFPFSVFFIVGNEFCERFSYYGMRAVLVLFLLNQLKFNENSATAIYHGFIVLCYLLPLFGAFIADSCLGKYGTILGLSVLYAVGNVIVSVSAIPIVLGLNIALTMIGLIVIALGTGGIKPCVAAFGGDQFQETQTDMLRRFFSLFYFSINAGSVISTLLTPVLRSYVQCFGTCECFALAFGIPAVLMIFSIVVFVLGTRFYIIKKPQKEAARLYFDVPLSIATAVYYRFKIGKIEGKKFLHYACPNYSVDFMNDVKLFLKVLVMFLPLPIFWALFDQQGSRWTLQANRMNGRFGKFTIQPDQVQALNPILILVFIPIFETIIYPLFGKCHIFRKPLQRMVVGMILAGLAFVVAGIVQLKLQSAQELLKSGESKLTIYNGAPFTVDYRLEGIDGFEDNRTMNFSENHLYSSISSGDFELTVLTLDNSMRYSIELHEFNITQVFITFSEDVGLEIDMVENREYLPDGGHSNIQVINLVENMTLSNFSVTIEPSGGVSSAECTSDQFNVSDLLYGEVSELKNLTLGKYNYFIQANDNTSNTSSQTRIFDMWNGYENSSFEQEFEGGAIYTIIVSDSLGGEEREYKLTVVEIRSPNSVSIFLQVPMYFLITAGEVMFSVTGLEFAYSQAPASMKAMCQAAWLLTVATGNFVVIIVAESSAFSDQALEFFFFAILIGAIAVLFAIMSFFYKYVNISDNKKDDSVTPDVNNDESTALIPEQNGKTYETETGTHDKDKFDDSDHPESEF